MHLFKGEVRDGADGEGAGGRAGEEQDQGGRHGRDGDEALGAVPPTKPERRRGDVAGLELTDFTQLLLLQLPSCLPDVIFVHCNFALSFALNTTHF